MVQCSLLRSWFLPQCHFLLLLAGLYLLYKQKKIRLFVETMLCLTSVQRCVHIKSSTSRASLEPGEAFIQGLD